MRRQLPCRPGIQRLCFRTWNEDPGAHLHFDGTKSSTSDQVLQRNAPRALRHQISISPRKVRCGLGKTQLCPRDPQQVGGQFLGVYLRTGNTCPRKRFGCLGEQLTQAAHHASCRRAFRSAAANASNRASRSPSRTWSRLCALNPTR
ncbi:Uncharacterised protein [Mycobacteroides abscessus subsp. massiliense]|nr:Uncharacterised protein [Mycobacteroides abscessus subsp. massiliense]